MKSELIDAFISGDLSGESEKFVRHALENDESLRERYLEQLRIHEALKIMMGSEEQSSTFSEGVVARLRSEAAGTELDVNRGFAKSVLTEILEERKVAKRHYWPDMIKAGLVAAAAAVIAVMALQHVSMGGGDRGGFAKKGKKKETTGKFVARVTGSDGVVWGADSAEVIREDGWIGAREISLNKGVAEITFNSGARVFLEGPATLSLEHSNRGFLEYGRLTAEVPRRASGFVINTPRLNVVDIGTRFGVAVEANGDTEVHVMQGVVEASRTSGNSVPIRLVEGLAVKADSRTRSELRPVQYAGEMFTLNVQPEDKPAHDQGFIHYSFDESSGSVIEDSGQGIEGGPFDTTLLISSEDSEVDSGISAMPRRAPGYEGGALVFQPGELLVAQLPNSFLLDEAFTLSFWVKIPPRSSETPETYIAKLGSPESSSEWGISWNQDAATGTRNALKIQHGNGYLVGSTDIRDGQWHHVTLRFLGGEKADLATHVHLFVDGEFETISDAVSVDVKNGRADQLKFGSIEGGFEGWIDEIFLHRAAIAEPLFKPVRSDLEMEGLER